MRNEDLLAQMQVQESVDSVERMIKFLRNLAKDCDSRKDEAVYSVSRRQKADATLPYLTLENDFIKTMISQARSFRAKADDLEVELTRFQRRS